MHLTCNFVIILLIGTGAEQTQSSASSEEQQTFGQRAFAFFSRPWRSSNTGTTENDSLSSSNTSSNTNLEAGNPSSPPQTASSPGSTAAATVPVIAERSSSRGALDIEGGEIESSGSGGSASRTTTTPVCLICLETLAPEDFASGRAISLGCKCRGDMALRHRDCAQKWAQVKDDGRGGVPICELCKQPTKNLPPIPPRPHLLRPDTAAAAGGVLPEDMYNDQMAFATFAPSAADLIFDCIRVTWVAMIVSILFFEASLGSALSTGMFAGAAYAVMVRIMYRQHFEAMRAYASENAAAVPPAPQVPVNVV